jgi:hypothetical protein
VAPDEHPEERYTFGNHEGDLHTQLDALEAIVDVGPEAPLSIGIKAQLLAVLRDVAEQLLHRRHLAYDVVPHS